MSASKKLGINTTSSTEAEIVSLDAGTRLDVAISKVDVSVVVSMYQ